MNTIIVLSGVLLIAIVGTVYLMYFDKEPQSGEAVKSSQVDG